MRLPISAASYAAAIEGLTRLDERILAGADFPPLYEAGVVYKREARDVWRHADDVRKSGWGDCEDLAAWRAAELRVSGEDPKAHVAVYQSGPRRFHAIVARGDGSTEDPSRRLGMKPGGRSPMGTLEGETMPQHQTETKQDRRARARAIARYCVQEMRREPIGTAGAWIGIGDDPTPDNLTVTFDLYKSGHGWSGLVRIPVGARGAIIAKTSPTAANVPGAKAKTAAKTVRLASKIAKLPGVDLLVPPQARAAVAVLKSPVGKLAVAPAAKLLTKLF
jgi:hypothetical protein